MINTNYNITPLTFTGYNKISLSKLEQYLAEGLTKKEIAEQFGVSVSTISRIIKNFGIETPNQRIKKNIDAILMPYTTQNPTLSRKGLRESPPPTDPAIRRRNSLQARTR